jgi:hypothetical protein
MGPCVRKDDPLKHHAKLANNCPISALSPILCPSYTSLQIHDLKKVGRRKQGRKQDGKGKS